MAVKGVAGTVKTGGKVPGELITQCSREVICLVWVVPS